MRYTLGARCLSKNTVIQETYKLLPTIRGLVCSQILYSILCGSLGYPSLFIWNLVTTCGSFSPLYRSLSVPGIVNLNVTLKNSLTQFIDKLKHNWDESPKGCSS